MWLNPDVFDWNSMVEGSKIYTGDSWKRAHKIWSHVEEILGRPTNEFERTNAIIDLRRAIDRRVQLLNERYAFRRLPIKDKPSDSLELLGFVGIVRPRMLQKLIDIRNAVEHEDAEPPSEEMCQVYLEFTWYFLRSTDLIVQRIVDSILFEQDEDGSGCWIEVAIRPPDSWIPIVRGWISADLISNEPKDNWIPLKMERSETRMEAIERLKEEDDSKLTEVSGWGRNDSDVYISAEVRGPGDILRRLYRTYFELVW